MNSKALQLGLVAVVVAVAAYFGLNWLAPIEKEEAAAQTGPASESVFAGSVDQSAGETAAAAPEATTAEAASPEAPAPESAAASESIADPVSDPAPVDPGVDPNNVAGQETAPVAPGGCETIVGAGDKPIVVDAVEVASSGTPGAEPAPAEETVAAAEPSPPAQETVAAVEPPPPAPAPEPEPAPSPAPAPAAETPAAPASVAAGPVEETAPRPKPAPKKLAPVKRWWPETPSSDKLNLVYAGDAAFSRSVALLFDSDFSSADAANGKIKVLDSGGAPVKGSWLLNLKNKKMLLFKVPSRGRYTVALDGALADASGKTLGAAQRGAVNIE